jgi:F-type H+-transporting ATPase subunit b
MRLEWSTIALQTINFVVLVWLLQRFLYKPVLRMIDARKAELQQQYDNAKATEQQAKADLAVVEAERTNIAAERDAVLKAAATQEEEAAKARRAQAEREAAALLDASRNKLVIERDKVLSEARKVALDLGTDIARRLVTEIPVEACAEAWLQRIERYLTALPAAELVALVHQFEDGGALTVVTASPLAPEAIEAWCGRLHRVLGDRIAIAFEVNGDLIAGAELQLPSAVLRFSWRSALAAVRSEVEDDAHRRS